MAFKPIQTPKGAIVQGPGGSVRLVWNPGCAPKLNKDLSRRQEIIDSQVLRFCSPMVPKDTGALEKSGILGTSVGSGEVCYIAPHAAVQYYNTATTRSYDARRGGMWFERMKVAHKATILRLAGGK